MNSLFNENHIIYSLDTSALFAAFNERYPIANFPALWCKVEELIRKGRLKMSQVVFEEAMADSGIKLWCNQNNLQQYFQVPVDEFIQEKVSEILTIFPKLLDDRRDKSGADPWCIAFAQVTDNSIVVTEENPTDSVNRPKIPDVCNHFNVKCIKVVDLIKREKWIFNSIILEKNQENAE